MPPLGPCLLLPAGPPGKEPPSLLEWDAGRGQLKTGAESGGAAGSPCPRVQTDPPGLRRRRVCLTVGSSSRFGIQ